jgi:hypothetical protein
MRLLQTELFVSAISESFAMQNFCLTTSLKQASVKC